MALHNALVARDLTYRRICTRKGISKSVSKGFREESVCTCLPFLQVQDNLEAASRAKVELEQKLAELIEEKKDLEAALRQEERSKENLGEQLSEAGGQLQVRRRVP
jgi:hypothetical protein